MYCGPVHVSCTLYILCFFFNDTATTEIYTLSLHDALPISLYVAVRWRAGKGIVGAKSGDFDGSVGRASCSLVFYMCFFTTHRDRKSTRLNSSHANISYAVFCLKKKNIYTNCTLF